MIPGLSDPCIRPTGLQVFNSCRWTGTNWVVVVVALQLLVCHRYRYLINSICLLVSAYISGLKVVIV